MNTEFEFKYLGGQLGEEAANRTSNLLAELCSCERTRIELSNQPRIAALRLEGARLAQAHDSLMERQRHAAPPGQFRVRRLNYYYYSIVAAFLAISGYIFCLLSFEPFELGWKAYLYSLGTALVTQFLLERYLDSNGNPRTIRVITAVACLAALTGLVLLAVIRGDILAQKMQQLAPALILDDASPAPQPTTDFFGHTVILLRIIMGVLAVAMEVGSGLAIYELRRLWNRSSEDFEKLSAALLDVQQKMVAITYEIVALTSEPATFVATFRRDFCRSLLTRTVQNSISKLLLFILALGLIGAPHAFGEPLNLVIAIDLSKSVDAPGPDQKTEFQKNIDGVARVLDTVPAGSHVTILGITDRSFAQPYILLSAQVSSDEGYFHDSLAAARRQLVQAWKSRASKLRPSFPGTDILGGLLIAADLFHRRLTASKPVLIIFSDMRQETAKLDLVIPSNSTERILSQLKQEGAIANLQGVEVQVLGVDAAGWTTFRWNALRAFWTHYFELSGAKLQSFSVLR